MLDNKDNQDIQQNIVKEDQKQVNDLSQEKQKPSLENGKDSTQSKSKSLSKSKSKSKSQSRKQKKEKKSRKSVSRSHSRSRDKKNKKKHSSKRHNRSKSRSRSEKKKSKKHRKHRRESKDKSRSTSEVREQNYGKFLSHYGNQIKTSKKENFSYSQKFDNSGLYWDGFHWISPEVQENKIIRSVTVYGLPFDQVDFTNEQFQQFLTVYMAQHRLADAGNDQPISNCIINPETTLAEVEFSSIEECQRVALIGYIEVLGKKCKVQKKHDSNPYKQQMGLEQAQNAAKNQALIMQSIQNFQKNLYDQKNGVMKVEAPETYNLNLGSNLNAMALPPKPVQTQLQTSIAGFTVPNLLAFTPNQQQNQ